jgi:hypothetical protein
MFIIPIKPEIAIKLRISTTFVSNIAETNDARRNTPLTILIFNVEFFIIFQYKLVNNKL